MLKWQRQRWSQRGTSLLWGLPRASAFALHRRLHPHSALSGSSCSSRTDPCPQETFAKDRGSWQALPQSSERAVLWWLSSVESLAGICSFQNLRLCATAHRSNRWRISPPSKTFHSARPLTAWCWMTPASGSLQIGTQSSRSQRGAQYIYCIINGWRGLPPGRYVVLNVKGRTFMIKKKVRQPPVFPRTPPNSNSRWEGIFWKFVITVGWEMDISYLNCARVHCNFQYTMRCHPSTDIYIL